MGNLDSKGDLAAAEIAFFAPAFIVSILVVIRHGLSRQLGWLYLVTLSILRLIGASCILYAETQNDTSASLLTCAAITSAVGTAPLLLALLGFLERLNQGMGGYGFSVKIFSPIHLASILALILAIVGGDFEASGGDQQSTGRNLMEAAAVIFLLIYLALVAITIMTQRRKNYLLSTESKLLYAGLAALPFLLVRIIYTLIVSFASSDSSFYFRNVNVWASTFMQFLMEAIVVTFFATAGLMTPKQAATESAPAPKRGNNVEILSGPDPDRVHEMESGRAQQQQQQQSQVPVYQQPRRSPGDYRPSRLIRDAISGRR